MFLRDLPAVRGLPELGEDKAALRSALTKAIEDRPSLRTEDLQVVAAHPLRDERGDPIGVLSASSDNDDGTFATPHGLEALTELAIIVSRVLIDLRTHAEE